MKDADKVVRDILNAADKGVDLQEFARAVWLEFDGAAGLSAAFHEVYMEATGQVKARMMADLMRLFQVANSESAGDDPEDLEEELRQIIAAKDE